MSYSAMRFPDVGNNGMVCEYMNVEYGTMCTYMFDTYIYVEYGTRCTYMFDNEMLLQ